MGISTLRQRHDNQDFTGTTVADVAEAEEQPAKPDANTSEEGESKVANKKGK